MNRYEGMFLFDPGKASDWGAVEGELDRLYGRIGANKLVAVKFDERKLAFEIKKRKRGLYVLSYFEADPTRIGELERDARLSDMLLRILVLSANDLTEERLTELRSQPPEQAIAPAQTDRRDDERGDRDGDRGGRFGGRRDRDRDRDEGGYDDDRPRRRRRRDEEADDLRD